MSRFGFDVSEVKLSLVTSTPQAEPEIGFTVFHNLACDKASALSKSWPELCEMLRTPDIIAHGKLSAPLLKMASFGDERNPSDDQPDESKRSLRHTGNLLNITGLEADYDDGKMPMEEAITLLEKAGIKACIYSSWGDGLIEPPKYLGGPRWRVVAPFSEPLSPALRSKMVARLNGALGGVLADESFTLAQGFFIGARPGGDYKCKVTFRDPSKGEYIDDLTQLDNIAIFKQRHSLEDSPDERYGVKVKPGSVIVAPEVYADLKAALAVIPADIPYPEWFRIIQALSRLSDKYQAKALAREWSTSSDNPEHTAQAFEDKWRSAMREDFLVSYTTVFYEAGQAHPGWDKNRNESAETLPGSSVLPEVYSIADFDLNNLPPIKFIVPDWLPAGKLTLFSGHGGSGKSSIMLQLGALLSTGGQHALGHQLQSEPYRVLFVSGEDEPVVNMTRLRGILRARPTLSHANIAENLKFMNVAGCRTTTLVDFDARTGKHSYSSLYKHLKEQCELFKPDVIITDNNSILFGGNEIDRNQIQTYIHCVQNIYPTAAVVALHHVDKASVGREDGDGWSGSTQWHNAARARWTLSTINGEMTLYLRKSNYGHEGWRGSVNYDEQARSHRMGEFTRLTRDQETSMRAEHKEQAKLSAQAEREQADRVAILSALSNAEGRYPSAYALLTSLGGRYEAYKKTLTLLLDEGSVMETALPEGVKGESNRQKTYLVRRDRDTDERYKI